MAEDAESLTHRLLREMRAAIERIEKKTDLKFEALTAAVEQNRRGVQRLENRIVDVPRELESISKMEVIGQNTHLQTTMESEMHRIAEDLETRVMERTLADPRLSDTIRTIVRETREGAGKKSQT